MGNCRYPKPHWKSINIIIWPVYFSLPWQDASECCWSEVAWNQLSKQIYKSIRDALLFIQIKHRYTLFNFCYRIIQSFCYYYCWIIDCPALFNLKRDTTSTYSFVLPLFVITVFSLSVYRSLGQLFSFTHKNDENKVFRLITRFF